MLTSMIGILPTRGGGALALVLCLAWPAAASAQTPTAPPWSEHFKIDSEVVAARGGRTMVQGSIQNLGRRAASRIQLVIEGLDASGNPVSKRMVYVSGTIGAGSHGAFESPAPSPGETFRVSVLAWEWSR